MQDAAKHFWAQHSLKQFEIFSSSCTLEGKIKWTCRLTCGGNHFDPFSKKYHNKIAENPAVSHFLLSCRTRLWIKNSWHRECVFHCSIHMCVSQLSKDIAAISWSTLYASLCFLACSSCSNAAVI